MPDSENSPAGGRPILACSRCGSATSQPFASTGGVCLRCAGERAFGLGSGAPFEDLSSAPPDAPGRIGPYEIIEELGRGGMGRVFAARQSGLGRIVALKALPVGDGGAAELELRFLREAQTVARLRHPHIVAIHDSGRTANHVYFSMDYIEGGDLAHRLREQPFAPRAAAVLVEKIAGALAYAHTEDVLHRDLKPSNILLDGHEPRLADFGLAAQLEAGGDLTAASGVLGTPHYLAPEALHGGSAALSIASDLYALGVVLYEMLTGRTPFAGASPAELPALIHDTDPPALRLLAPAVPPDLETICLKCLERDPARRYPSAAALAEDLRRWLAGEPIRARPPSGAGRFLRWCRRRPALAAIWFLVTTLAVVSSWSSVWIFRARTAAEQSLAVARTAEASARERLREAKLGEARAIRRTDLPGRRAQALAALAEAAHTRPGLDLRNEALAALWLTDIHADATWNLETNAPAEIMFDPTGRIVAVEMLNVGGLTRGPASLREWGRPTARPALEIPGTRAIGHLRYSPDGSLVMARYLDETLRVWRTGDSKLLLTVPNRPLPGGAVLSNDFNDDYDFSPDGRMLALGLPGHGVSLLRIADGSEAARWDDGVLVNVVRFSPDGAHVAAARTQGRESRQVYVLPAADLKLAERFDQAAAPKTFGWSSDGHRLYVATEDNALAEFDVGAHRLLARLSLGTHDPVQVLSLDHDRLIATRGVETKLHLTNATSGRLELILNGLGSSLIAAVPGGSAFISSRFDGLATRWEVDSPVGFQVIPPPAPSAYIGSNPAGTIDVSPDGRWVASGHGRYTLIREISSGRFIAEWDAGPDRPMEMSTVAFEPDGRALLVCSNLLGLRRHALVPTADGALAFGPAQTLDAAPGFVMVTCSADRHRCVLVNFESGDVKIVDPTPAGAVIRAHWNTPGVYNAALSPDAEKILVNVSGQGPNGATQRIRVYRVADGAVLTELTAHVSCDAAWSRDGRTAITSNGPAESIIWDTATWQPRVKLAGALGGDSTTFAFSPDSHYAVVVKEDHIHLMSLSDGVPFATLEVPDAASLALGVKFMPDGHSFLVLWPDGRIDRIDPDALHAALVPLGLAW